MSSRQFLYIVIATFITAMIWVVLDIIHANSQVQTPPEVQALLEPVNPQIDQETIDGL